MSVLPVTLGQGCTLSAPRYLALPLFIASFAVALPSHAQQLRLHATGAGAHAIGGHQQRELALGSTARAAAEWVLVREFGILVQGSGTFLGAGDRPLDTTLKPLDAAAGYSVAAGVHLRPLARKTYGRVMSPAGLWLGGAGGFMWTAGERRPMADAALGFDFLFSKARIGFGPMVGWEHVFQPNDQLRPDDANILFAGLHAVLEIGVTQGSVDGDQDEDGIRDFLDKCPTVPEDLDHFEDEDGCPDRDNDQDSVLDPDDQCPLVAEDRDKFQDSDGCPEADNDQDGILDAKDKCPNDPEDKDNFEDEDGCPDRDNDQDGIPDREDLCPNEPETKNGYADQDGCPDAEQIRVVGDKIVLDDRVHFMINSHIIRNISYPLLERLAALINEHPEYVHIEIQGHTDERGPDWFNERLSQTRADSVMQFLVSRGVKAERLTAKGYGKSKPLVEKRTEYAYYMNRRVEFEITRQVKQRTDVETLKLGTPTVGTKPGAPTVDTRSTKPEVESQSPTNGSATPSEPIDPDDLEPEVGPDETEEGQAGTKPKAKAAKPTSKTKPKTSSSPAKPKEAP